jgi:methyltransferase
MVTALWGYTALLVLVGVERIAELFISKRNAAEAFAKGAVEVGQAHYRVMALFHTLFLFSCLAEAWLVPHDFAPVLGWLALAGAVLAQGLRYWAITTLGRRWNTRIIVMPEAEPVTGGPYRFLKHPNYLAVVAEMVCLPLIYGGFVTAIVFSLGNAAILFVRIRAEERALGSKYAAAFAGKSRFLPGASRV